VHRPEQVAGLEAGLLPELALRRLLERLALAQPATGGEPERRDLRAVRIPAAEQQQAIAPVEQQQPGGPALDRGQASVPKRMPCASGSSPE
jgi:hypothetical protein